MHHTLLFREPGCVGYTREHREAHLRWHRRGPEETLSDHFVMIRPFTSLSSKALLGSNQVSDASHGQVPRYLLESFSRLYSIADVLLLDL